MTEKTPLIRSVVKYLGGRVITSAKTKCLRLIYVENKCKAMEQ